MIAMKKTLLIIGLAACLCTDSLVAGKRKGEEISFGDEDSAYADESFSPRKKQRNEELEAIKEPELPIIVIPKFSGADWDFSIEASSEESDSDEGCGAAFSESDEVAMVFARREPTADDVACWFDAISSGDVVLVKKFMAETMLGISADDGGSIDQRNYEALTGLTVAMLTKNYPIMSLLMGAGAEVDVLSSCGKLAPVIIYAATVPYRTDDLVGEAFDDLWRTTFCDETLLDEAFKWACHCPKAETFRDAYMFARAENDEYCTPRILRSVEFRMSPNPYLVAYLAEKLGIGD